MDLIQFKKDIEKELELSILGNGETPILDRLQIHLDNLSQEYNLSTMLNPQNIQHELYLSMIYQIVYPAKKRNIFKIFYNGKEIEGNTDRAKIQNLVIEVGVENIKKLKSNKRFLYKKNIDEVVGNAYKVVDENHSFDTSFGGVGASTMGRYFINEIKDTLNLDIEIKYEETFSYN